MWMARRPSTPDRRPETAPPQAADMLGARGRAPVTSTLSADDILLGLGLVVVLAVASQLLARRLGLPAIVVLLPAGFVAGVATDAVDPDDLLGGLYQPFVSLAVGVILFEAGM